jgi:hypothetical protein
MTRQKVTDPALLAQLGESPRQKVTDPNLLEQLNSNDDPIEDDGDYLDNLPAPEGSHPLRSFGIGLTHAARNLHNLPHDIAAGIEGLNNWYMGKDPYWKQQQKSDNTFKLSEHLPYDDQSYADVFGQKGEGTMMDKFIQKGTEYAPDIIGGLGLLRGGFRRLTGAHHLDQVARAIEQRGVNNFSFHPSTEAEARNYLPRSHATEEMLARSNAGHYPSSFSTQSQIGKHQRDLAKSPLASERLLAPRAGELKQNMLGELEGALRTSGMHNEADMLRNGINNYRQYKQVMNAAMPVIKYLGIPTTILTSLGFAYNKGKKALSD